MKKIVLILFLSLTVTPLIKAQTESQNAVSASWIRENIITNPVTTLWIKENLKQQAPRLILTDKLEKQLKQKIKDDKLVKTYYKYLRQYADEICTKPILEKKLIGRRMLKVSREAIRRMSILALVYRVERDDKYLDRLAEEIDAVSSFPDWNPSHFLDVAEMSYAVATGLDWAGEWLPEQTVKKARAALKKHLLISFQDEGFNYWVDVSHNWNQVCHAGLSASALVLADEYPKLAAKVISRAVNKLPIALASYSPDGAYPEGPSYWGYGTSFNLLAISFYQSALGTNFNLPKSPGFMKSAVYRMEVVAPSGTSFNYSDAGYDGLGLLSRGSLAWFAQKTGDDLFLNKKKVRGLVQKAMKTHELPPRIAPAQLLWLAQFNKKESHPLPVYWKGEGHNPIAIFRAKKNESTGFYLGVKGGSASVNHGNMDVGSFIFELNGVRWAIDPGTQSYHALEEIIGSNNLWDESQGSQRWSLLTKNNRFHSTLTVNGERHRVEGFAPITEFKTDSTPKLVSLDLSTVFKGQLASATRTFKKMDANTLQIEDNIVPTDQPKTVTWAMMTKAQVTTTNHGAILHQNGEKLHLKIIQPANLNISVQSLNPPPLPYDKKVDNLKRIEITVPYYILEKQQPQKIVVELKGQE